MKIGVTGTRNDITEKQMVALAKIFASVRDHADKNGFTQPELHHGDCVGADDMAARLAYIAGFKVVCHPPVKTDLIANAPSHEHRPPKGYFQRNRAIVDEVDFLLVVPKDMEHQPMGGTWYTHDYAVKTGKPLKILWPS